MKKITLLSIKGTTFSLVVILFMTGCMAFSVNDNYKRMKYGVPPGVYLGEMLLAKMLEDEVETYLSALDMELSRQPRNAYSDPATGQILPEIYGEKIDVYATLNEIMRSESYTAHHPVFITLDPEITVDIYRNIRTKKGSYMTGFGGGNRGTNISLAAYYINNYLLAPGETFSFNKTTMSSDPKKGYKPAPIIVGGSVVPGYGGGVCQVSSTLYNAVRKSGLEVVERFPHSQPVGYVPTGMDATVSDYLDFKFRNNTDRFIMIKASTWGYRLVVEIWE
jgi:vancomycin resistance protein YoaR